MATSSLVIDRKTTPRKVQHSSKTEVQHYRPYHITVRRRPASPQSTFSSRLHSPSFLHMTDISYPESYLRTPISQTPWYQSKWHKPYSEAECQVVSPILEEPPMVDENGDEIRQSVERGETVSNTGEQWGDGTREWNGCEERWESVGLKRQLHSEELDDANKKCRKF
ncbi:hypothetical protein GQ44DRAFT_771793 [Phaeosphaeriaceae sp. PMI808]|nr:hypothetical protein GQ44DRAFT_771793 [Phaeosphaeriaceae sp. PMI808]